MPSNNPGGRPRKFGEPARPVTVTLPERTLRQLESIDADRAQAITRLADEAAGIMTEPPDVEVVEMAPNTGLIVIGPCEPLRRIPFLHLVEVARRRFIIALDPGHDFRALEIALLDVLDDLDEGNDLERPLVARLLDHVRALRKSDRVRMGEILFVSLKKDMPAGRKR